jgi:hypothetical protein
MSLSLVAERDILVGCTAVGFLWVFVASSRNSVFLVEYFLFLSLFAALKWNVYVHVIQCDSVHVT